MNEQIESERLRLWVDAYRAELERQANIMMIAIKDGKTRQERAAGYADAAVAEFDARFGDNSRKTGCTAKEVAS